jgi:hypothetical protein
MSGNEGGQEAIMKIRATLLVVLASACRTIQVPPCKVVTEWGIVRASTREAAEKLSAIISTVAPRVLAVVPGLERKVVDVRLLSRVRGYRPFDLAGATTRPPLEPRIEIAEAYSVDNRDAVIAHELVHFWLGPDWHSLPPAMEEGLACLVEGTLMPEGFVENRLYYVVAMSSMISGAFQIDSYGAAVGRRNVPFSLSIRSQVGPGGTNRVRQILAMDEDAFDSEGDEIRYFGMVSCGFLLASKIGVERLHEVCLRAKQEGRDRIPPDWILDAAGLLNADLATWNDAILVLYGRSEQEELLRHPPWIHSSQSGIHPPVGVRPTQGT